MVQPLSDQGLRGQPTDDSHGASSRAPRFRHQLSRVSRKEQRSGCRAIAGEGRSVWKGALREHLPL